jgi:hypothetical protein
MPGFNTNPTEQRDGGGNCLLICPIPKMPQEIRKPNAGLPLGIGVARTPSGELHVRSVWRDRLDCTREPKQRPPF